MRYALLISAAVLSAGAAHAEVRIDITKSYTTARVEVDCKKEAMRVLANGEEPAPGEHRRWENFIGKSKYAVKAGYRVSGDTGGMHSVGETCYRTN